VWLGGRGRDIRGTKGGREREEQMWGVRRVRQIIRIDIDLLTTMIQYDGEVRKTHVMQQIYKATPKEKGTC
jgi:hypothetical protein